MVSQSVVQAWNDFSAADDNQKARMIGKTVGDIALNLIAGEGIGVSMNALKAVADSGKLADLLSDIGKGTKTAEDAVSSLSSSSYDISDLLNTLKTVSTTDEAITKIGNTSFTNFADNDIYGLIETVADRSDWTSSDISTVQKEIAEKGGWIGKYYTDNMDIIWPPNDGFAGTPQLTTLQEGTIIDRYGNTGGSFLAPEGTPYDNRSLAPGTKETRPYFKYKVLEPLNVYEGEIAPWFGKPGGGVQYYLGDDVNVQQLLDENIIEEVN